MNNKPENKHLEQWKTLSKETILDFSKFLKVEQHTIQLPSGGVIPDWPWIEIPSAAIVLPVTEKGLFPVFRQVKYAVEGTSLAPVGGMLEPGEAPLDAAKRELLEEMGYETPDWVHLGSFVLDPNRGIASMHLFLAQDVRKVAEPNADDLEEQELMLMDRQQIESALMSGEFKVLSWSAVVSMALNYLKNNTVVEE